MANDNWPVYTKVPANLWQTIQSNSGIIVTGFDPTDGSYESIIGATGGDVSFTPNPEYYDLGEGINNLPANTKQLKRVRSYDPRLAGTFKGVTQALVAMLQAAAAASGSGIVSIIPSHDLKETDFKTITLLGDYSDVNTGASAGFFGITVYDAINTLGLQWTTHNRDKGDFPFEFHGHYDLTNLDRVPFAIYMRQGVAPTP